MVQSMTGIGSAEKNGYKIEIRSLNHRFLDITVKSPSSLAHLDMQFRTLLKERLSRGKIDVAVTVSGQATPDFRVNTSMAGKICSAFETLQKELALPGRIEIATMLPFHGMFLEIDQACDKEALAVLFREAIGHLAEMRELEGKALASELLKMAGALSEMNRKMKDESAASLKGIKEKFAERIKIILEGQEPDSQRILQEAALLAMKYDIAEETARIESHLKQFGALLCDEATNAVLGKKLDFIIQELNREVNTIASKSSGYAQSALAVEMKAVIEQMREQVQNVQ